MNKVTKTLKVKLKLDYLQKLKIETLSNEHRMLYNHLLNFARNYWYNGKGVDFKGINEEYKKYREENNLTIPSKSAQNTSRLLINNIKSFYALRKDKSNNAKFPCKFKSRKIFMPLILDFNNGSRWI